MRGLIIRECGDSAVVAGESADCNLPDLFDVAAFINMHRRNWNMGLHDFTFYDLIKRNAIRFGNRQCWCEVDDRRAATFAQLKAEVERLAGGLQKRGLKKGDRIGVLGKNSLEYFLLYGAASIFGAIMLPVNWRLSAAETCVNLADCEPEILFVDREF